MKPLCVVLVVVLASAAFAAPAAAAPGSGAPPVTRRAVPASELYVYEPPTGRAYHRRVPWTCGRGGDLDPWRWRIGLPLWVPGISGTLASGGIDVDTERSEDGFFDAITNFQFGFLGAVAHRRGRWEFMVDGLGLRVGSTVDFRLIDGTVAEGTLGGIVARVSAAYRFERRRFCAFGRRTQLDTSIYAGIRFYQVGLEIDRPRALASDNTKRWVDPIVGVKAKWIVHPRLHVVAEADMGGFTVGSEFAWFGGVGLEYRVSRLFSVGLGYQYLGFERRLEIGSIQNRWALRLSGPVLALGFRF